MPRPAIALLGALLLPLLAACSGGHHWSQQTRDNFMSSCADSADDSTCTCALNKLQNSYSEQEIARIERSILSGGDLPSGVVNAIKACKKS